MRRRSIALGGTEAAMRSDEAIMTAVRQTRRDAAELKKALMLIGGKWVESASGEVLEVEDPAHRRPIAEIPRGRVKDGARAVNAAAEAFPAWSRMIPRERGRLLARVADPLEPRIEELARTIALETGNALRTQARPKAKTTVDIIRYFGGLGGELKGETIPLGEHVLSYTRREPLGVVGGIIPWNAPVLLAALKIGPALCAGNTLVLKAAEDAPLGVLLLAEVCQEFLPPGVLNVLTGLGEECGAPLANHPTVGKLSFTGSTEVGKLIMRAASDRIVPVSLELGGKSPSIVFPDANEDWVIDSIIAAMRFTRQSQSCTAGSRLFLHHDIFDKFLDALGQKVKALKLGDPLDEASDIGTVINEKQFKKVCGYVEEGLNRREARIVIGSLPPKEGPLSEGYYTIPTISRTWRTTGTLRERRSSVPCSSPSPGPTMRTPSVWQMTVTMGLLPTSGRMTSAAHFAPRMRSRPAGSRSTRALAKLPVTPTAAIRKAASVESSHLKECSRAIRKGRTSR
jgi:betaine-aldehyde dehydrogenase